VDLRVHRTLPYPPERVWRALTDPVALAAWFWPQRFEPTAEVDLRVGGRYRIAGPAAGMAVSGEYVAVEPPRRLAFTWQWDGEPEQTLVTAELTARDAGTDLVIVHERFTDGADRDEHAKGWTDCLDRLPDWLRGSAAEAGQP
jgi:uncharacterized protein YndB with AHSA1/START domain